MSPDDKPMPPSAAEMISSRLDTEDPPLLYERHVFVCTNHSPEGHPARLLQGPVARENLPQLHEGAGQGTRHQEHPHQQRHGCLERCQELGPSMVVYPEGVWYRPQDQRRYRRDPADAT